MSGRIYTIAAPSGGGKTSLVRALLARMPDLEVSVSHTTRPMRPAEVEGKDYFFVDDAAFNQLKGQGGFLECANVYGFQYGTAREFVDQRLEVGKDVILEIDWQGAQQIKRLYQDRAVSIYILPPSVESLRQRLLDRQQDAPEVIQKRLGEAQNDISHAQDFDFLIINDQFEQALDQLERVILAQRQGQALSLPRHEALIQQLISNKLSN